MSPSGSTGSPTCRRSSRSRSGGGWTVRPKGFLSRERTFINVDYQADRTGAVISRQVVPGFGMDTKWDGFMQFRFERSHVRAGDLVFPRSQFAYIARVNPSRRFQQVSVEGFLGSEVDFVNARPGRGGTVNLNATINATDHLVFDMIGNTTWLHVDDRAGIGRPLFTARVERLRANYTFTARSFVRLIGQYVSTDRDPALFLRTIPAHDGFFSGSVLFAIFVRTPKASGDDTAKGMLCLCTTAVPGSR